MIGGNSQKSLIETAALSGNLDMLKSLFAQSETQPIVSPQTLIELFQYGKSEVGLYIMEHAKWDEQALDEEVKKQGYDSALAFFIKHSNNDEELSDYLEYWVREEFAMERLSKAIKANDVDLFEKIYQNHFGENGLIAKLIASTPNWLDNKLTNTLYNNTRRFLRKNNLESVSEQLTPKDADYGYCALCRLISEVPRENATFIAKFIELGYDGAYNGEQTIEEWCRFNYCEDLLELPHVKKQVEKDKHLQKVRDCFGNPKPIWGAVKDYLNSVPEDQRAAAIADLTFLTPDISPLWQYAAMHNQVEVLSYPGVLPKEGISSKLHEQILKCASTEGQEDVVYYLIKHARLYMPSALRFSEAELGKLKEQHTVYDTAEGRSKITETGNMLFQRLLRARERPFTPMKDEPKSYSQMFFEGISYLLGADELYDAPQADSGYDLQENLDYCFSPDLLETSGRKALTGSRSFT